VTPFRSMVQDLINRRDDRAIITLYGNDNVNEIAYADVFDRAKRELGIKTVYAVAEDASFKANMHKGLMHQGLIDAALIQREVPDYKERVFYTLRAARNGGEVPARSEGAGGRPLPHQGGFLSRLRLKPRGRRGIARPHGRRRGRDPAVSYFLRPFRNIRPSRKALSVQSPFGAGGETDCLNCLICLTPRPNRNRTSVQAPSEVCGSCFSSRIFSARALARSFSVAAGSRRMAAIARSFRRIASADGASWLTGTGEFPRIESIYVVPRSEDIDLK
jgi:hypothetical protein